MHFSISQVEKLFKLLKPIIGEGRIESWKEKGRSFLKKIFNLRQKQYFEELNRVLKEMPFIYRDHSEVLTGFQGIRYRIVIVDQRTNLIIEEAPSVPYLDVPDRIAYLNKAIIFGSAGIGKSTFVRYITLCLTKKIKNDYGIKGSTPIFIQLKTLGNIDKSPVIKYLLSDLPLFTGLSVIDVVKKIEQNRYLFILDGYDEMPSSGKENFLKDEISIFFRANLSTEFAKQGNIDPKLIPIYKQIDESSRVWLTTREEFYALNPIKSAYAYENYYNNKNYTSFVKFYGLTDNREKYAEAIFLKYRDRNVIFKEKLDAHQLIREIEHSSDDNFRLLTYIPFFLTIICYVYVEAIEKSYETNDIWKKGISELIDNCINALLKDIDAHKVRDFPENRKAILTRSLRYFQEKKSFLEYLAYVLFVEQISVFDSSYLAKKTMDFFLAYPTENSSQILSEINDRKFNNSNFVSQLLYSGVFVTTSFKGNSIQYDFPHRRFREVLASQYLEKNIVGQLGKELLLSFIKDNETLSEFLLFYCQTAQPDHVNIIVEYLMNQCADDAKYLYANTLLVQILRVTNIKHTSEPIENVLKDFIAHDKTVRISSELIKLSAFTAIFIAYCTEILMKESPKINSINIILSIFCWNSATRSLYVDLISKNKFDRDNYYLQLLIEKNKLKIDIDSARYETREKTGLEEFIEALKNRKWDQKKISIILNSFDWGASKIIDQYIEVRLTKPGNGADSFTDNVQFGAMLYSINRLHFDFIEPRIYLLELVELIKSHSDISYFQALGRHLQKGELPQLQDGTIADKDYCIKEILKRSPSEYKKLRDSLVEIMEDPNTGCIRDIVY